MVNRDRSVYYLIILFVYYYYYYNNYNFTYNIYLMHQIHFLVEEEINYCKLT